MPSYVIDFEARTFRTSSEQTIILTSMHLKAPWRSFLLWFVFGCAASAFLQWTQVQVMGGVPEGLLFAGTWQEVHPIVVEQLPNTPVFEGDGHDGQIFYAVGLDLRGEWVPDTLLSAPYRYRRILYPALAGGFGAWEGAGLLWGMITLSTLSVGLAAGAIGAIATVRALPGWLPVITILSPATWLSSRLLTADNLALALGLLAVLAFSFRRDALVVIALAAAALAKEPAIAFAVGLAGFAWFTGERSRGLRIALCSGLPMAIWWGYIYLAIGNPLDSGGNVVAPLVGIARSIPVWGLQETRDWFYLVWVLTGCVIALWVLVRGHRLWAWLIGPWLAIAAVSSHLVWHLGNNAVRALGPIVVLGFVGALDSRRDRAISPAAAAP